ncbi:MAG: hypothetical protein IK134_12070 [Oscillospiraceae bacterium]|nr:hypothetical protein [Oscillospiraceae bacterium]
MIEQDYLLRQIKEFVAFLMKLLFDAELCSADALADAQQSSGGDNPLYRMIDGGQILEAEQLLYDNMQTKTADNLLKGYSFYQYLAQQEDDFLEAHHYSRSLIREGVRRLAALFDAAHLADIFLPELD